MKSNPIITDEMLAAYLAGNATAHETALILRAVEADPTIRETLHIMSELESEEDVLPMMAMAAKNEVDNLCAIRCIGYTLRHFGIDVSDEILHIAAIQSGSITELGMPFYVVGEIIRSYGLNAQYLSGCSLDSVQKNLENGTIVIALVDGGELTGDSDSEAHEDLSCGLFPDHVVVIDSLSKGQIVIRDSYTPQQLDTYSLEFFLDAWSTLR